MAEDHPGELERQIRSWPSDVVIQSMSNELEEMALAYDTATATIRRFREAARKVRDRLDDPTYCAATLSHRRELIEILDEVLA